MKKTIAILLVLALTAGFTACGGSAPAPTQSNVPQNTEAPKPQQTEAPAQNVPEETEAVSNAPVNNVVYAFTHDGITLTPGTAFDTAALPAADFVYQVPSCAFEGTDNVYSYGTYEVTAYDEGKGEFIYSIYLADPNITTAEGLALGDDVSRITELYGPNCVVADNQYTYLGRGTQLVIVVNNDFVASIEYRISD